MTNNIFSKTAILAVLTLIYAMSYTQTSSNLEAEIISKTSIKEKTNDIVINTKMIERFNAIYEEVEVISWQELLSGQDFNDVKHQFIAYNSMNLGNIENENLLQAIHIKSQEIQNDNTTITPQKREIVSLR